MTSLTSGVPEHSAESAVGLKERHAEADREFRQFVQDPLFPCLGAKSVLRLDSYTLRVYGALGSEAGTARFAGDLEKFSADVAGDGKGFKAFVAVFPDSLPDSETEFERALWRQLQLLHDADRDGEVWASNASSDATDPHFSFSFGGEAYFVVGLHPGSSRIARRFRWPALVFNPHAQFMRLRAEGRFDGLRSAIRVRDTALQGDTNPNLADFGEQSEARQYSGRKTETDWKCPFHRKSP
ncbi:MAG: guanitoxin biosynthesis heme-dependent pre-guanitoxin N-hydroxylase GntA [Gemmatimonadaceae bacterium]